MLTSYSRVTVVSGTRRVDLALPTSLPMSDVVPQVLRFCAPEEAPGGPAQFTLAKLGGQSLSLSQSLGDAGVHDGDVIELRTLSASVRPTLIEDVRDAIEDNVDEAGGAWTSQSTVTFCVGAASAVLLLVLLGPLADWAVSLLTDGPLPVWSDQEIVSAAIAALVLAGATWVASRWAAGWVCYLSSGVAALAAALTTAELTLSAGGSLTAALTAGAAAAAVLAGAMRLCTRRAMPLVAATVTVLAGCGIVLLATSIGADAAVVPRLVAMLAVLSIGVMPRLSIAVGGLSSADYRVRNAGRMSDAALRARFQESSDLLLGSIYGVCLLVGAIGFWLALRPDAWGHDLWDGLLSVSLALVVALRSRVFSRALYMLPLRVTAVVILLGTVIQLSGESATLRRWLAAALAVVGAAAIGVSITHLSEVTRARVKRTLNVVEFIMVVDLIVVTMGAVTLYSWVRER